jgi:hypothetical protein
MEKHRRRQDPAGGWLPGAEQLDTGEESVTKAQPARREWKLTVRLRASQHEQLAAASQLYGVRPTTLARMLINRGASAIVNSYRRDELGLGGDE